MMAQCYLVHSTLNITIIVSICAPDCDVTTVERQLFIYFQRCCCYSHCYQLCCVYIVCTYRVYYVLRDGGCCIVLMLKVVVLSSIEPSVIFKTVIVTA